MSTPSIRPTLTRSAMLACTLVLSPSALGQFEPVNAVAVGLRYYPDIQASTVQVTQNTYPGVLQIRETMPTRPTGSTAVARHIGVLSADSGVTPYVIPQARAWSFETTVRIEGVAATEGGLHVGILGPVSPWNFGANTGVLMINVDTTEIAAFGGWLPFFSTFQPQYANIAAAAGGIGGGGARGRDYRIGIRVTPVSMTLMTAEYFVNGVGTGPLPLDAGAVSAYRNGNNSAGVYAQNAWRSTGPTDATTTFSNFVAAPSPGAATLSLSALCWTCRRRRRPGRAD